MEKLETIEFDLGVYKILLQFHGKKEPLVIHFDTPSRRFYFSVITLIINEMKKQGKPGFFHIRKHQNILKLLDISLSGKHASEHVDGMWSKINMAWRHRLPDLETAALFKVLDRDLIAPYEKGGKYRYECSDMECDTWANLFGYDENNKWRFKLAIDSASISLNDISVTLGDLRDNSAWKEFVKSLSIQPKAVTREKRAVPRWWKKVAFSLVTILIVGAATLAIWNSYIRPVPPTTELELPDKPSIAVLPFVNMSGDPEQEYFSDGLTEEIITALSKVPKLFVIARNSSFTYKGKSVKVQQVSEDLGVRYVLEGSVRKAENRVRITAQLIDAITGHHVLSERYDRDLKDIFALQDDITMKIIAAIQVELTKGEVARLSARGTENLQAYLKYIQGVEILLRITKEDNALARKIFEDVIVLDPKYAAAYVLLGNTYWLDVFYGSSKSPKKSIAKAMELSQKAIALDEACGLANCQLGWLYAMTGKHAEAIAEIERALELVPNDANSHMWMSYVLRLAGRNQEAIRYSEQAVRLNPIPPSWYFRGLALNYMYAQRYDEAITTCKKGLDQAPNDILTHVTCAAIYGQAGRRDAARAEAEEVLKRNPKFSALSYAKRLPYKNQADRDFFLNGMRKAGLPETPPLPLPDKPSIAVLPFVNMSDDPEQEYFSDGLTEEIIAALSSVPKLFVIARNSTFTYKGKPVWVQQVSKELGVRYVLEGSVRKAGDKIRITAQLVDAINGHHLWAKRYDRNLSDIFAVQDEITKKIITAMQIKLTKGEQARTAAKGTNNLEAYLKCLQASEYIHNINIESITLAKQLAEEAIALDPDYAWAYYTLGRAYHVGMCGFRGGISPKQAIAKAIELVQKAIALDDTLAEAHGRLGFLYSTTKQYDKGVAEAEKAVVLDPNSAMAHVMLGKTLSFAGRWEESIPQYKKAIRLNPIPQNIYLYSLGLSYGMTGQYEEAITWCEKAVRQAPDSLWARIMMTVVYSMSGRDEDALVEAAEVLRINPKFSLKKGGFYKNKADSERFMGALHKAGLK